MLRSKVWWGVKGLSGKECWGARCNEEWRVLRSKGLNCDFAKCVGLPSVLSSWEAKCSFWVKCFLKQSVRQPLIQIHAPHYIILLKSNKSEYNWMLGLIFNYEIFQYCKASKKSFVKTRVYENLNNDLEIISPHCAKLR